MTTERIENMAGGQGHVLIKRLLNEKQLNGKCGLYAEVTLEPGMFSGIPRTSQRKRNLLYPFRKRHLQRQRHTAYGESR